MQPAVATENSVIYMSDAAGTSSANVSKNMEVPATTSATCSRRSSPAAKLSEPASPTMKRRDFATTAAGISSASLPYQRLRADTPGGPGGMAELGHHHHDHNNTTLSEYSHTQSNIALQQSTGGSAANGSRMKSPFPQHASTRAFTAFDNEDLTEGAAARRRSGGGGVSTSSFMSRTSGDHQSLPMEPSPQGPLPNRDGYVDDDNSTTQGGSGIYHHRSAGGTSSTYRHQQRCSMRERVDEAVGVHQYDGAAHSLGQGTLYRQAISELQGELLATERKQRATAEQQRRIAVEKRKAIMRDFSPTLDSSKSRVDQQAINKRKQVRKKRDALTSQERQSRQRSPSTHRPISRSRSATSRRTSSVTASQSIRNHEEDIPPPEETIIMSAMQPSRRASVSSSVYRPSTMGRDNDSSGLLLRNMSNNPLRFSTATSSGAEEEKQSRHSRSAVATKTTTRSRTYRVGSPPPTEGMTSSRRGSNVHPSSSRRPSLPVHETENFSAGDEGRPRRSASQDSAQTGRNGLNASYELLRRSSTGVELNHNDVEARSDAISERQTAYITGLVRKKRPSMSASAVEAPVGVSVASDVDSGPDVASHDAAKAAAPPRTSHSAAKQAGPRGGYAFERPPLVTSSNNTSRDASPLNRSHSGGERKKRPSAGESATAADLLVFLKPRPQPRKAIPWEEARLELLGPRNNTTMTTTSEPRYSRFIPKYEIDSFQRRSLLKSCFNKWHTAWELQDASNWHAWRLKQLCLAKWKDRMEDDGGEEKAVRRFQLALAWKLLVTAFNERVAAKVGAETTQVARKRGLFNSWKQRTVQSLQRKANVGLAQQTFTRSLFKKWQWRCVVSKTIRQGTLKRCFAQWWTQFRALRDERHRAFRANAVLITQRKAVVPLLVRYFSTWLRWFKNQRHALQVLTVQLAFKEKRFKQSLWFHWYARFSRRKSRRMVEHVENEIARSRSRSSVSRPAAARYSEEDLAPVAYDCQSPVPNEMCNEEKARNELAAAEQLASTTVSSASPQPSKPSQPAASKSSGSRTVSSSIHEVIDIVTETSSRSGRGSYSSTQSSSSRQQSSSNDSAGGHDAQNPTTNRKGSHDHVSRLASSRSRSVGDAATTISLSAETTMTGVSALTSEGVTSSLKTLASDLM